MYINVEDVPSETYELLNLDEFIDYIEIKELLKRIDRKFIKFEEEVDKLKDRVDELESDDSDYLYEMEVGK